jgi:hypothetical protein
MGPRGYHRQAGVDAALEGRGPQGPHDTALLAVRRTTRLRDTNDALC